MQEAHTTHPAARGRACSGGAAALLVLLLALLAPAHAGAIGKPYQELLTRLVEINSGSHNTAGLERVRAVLVPELERLGLVVTRHPLADGRAVLQAEVPGAQPRVLLVGHLDTVFEPGHRFATSRLEKDKLYGPGVIDMKGGIVLMVQLLAELKAAGALGSVRVVINDDEELGSTFSTPVLRQLARGVPYGLVFEPGLPDGALVTSESGIRWLELTVEGRAAHAGLEPESGVNACVELAHKVVAIAALNDPARLLTVNPDTLEGGAKTNIICERAQAKIDVRYVHDTDLAAALASIERIAARSTVFNPRRQEGTRGSVRELVAVPALPPEVTREVFEVAQQVGRKLGQKLTGRAVGYGSDGNYLAATGIKLLVGLGPYGGGMHTDQEFMLLPAYAERLALSRALVLRLAKGD